MADSHCHFNMLHSLPRAGAAIECLQDPDLTGHAAFFHFASFLSSFFWFPEAHGMPWLKGPRLIAGYWGLIGAASLPTMALNSWDGM